MKALISVVFSVLFYFPPLFASPEVLKYQDENGNVHYVDTIEKIPPEYRKQVENSKALPPISKLPRPDRPGYYEQEFTSSPTSPAKRNRSVEIFVTSWCHYCQELESFFKKKNIRYTRYDIERDKKGAAMHLQLGGGGVPVTKVGATVVRGYDPQGILEALKH